MPKQKYQKIITALLLCLSILLIVAGCSSDSAQNRTVLQPILLRIRRGISCILKKNPNALYLCL